jgi:SAM-dependent methyltransferase
LVKQNHAHWTELARIHAQPSRYYDIDGFKAGGLSLRALMRDEVGDVRGKTLLHLQCHIGLDTLSWARLGASVTGLDFCEDALAYARRLAAECALPARFVCGDGDALPDGIGEAFDIVFTSFGTTTWLPDLDRWARLVACSLRPGGMFYVMDGHPFSRCLKNRGDSSVLRVVETYFSPREPEHCEPDTDYAVTTARSTEPSYEWTHSLGEIVTAIASAGLRIEFLHEFPCCDFDFLHDMRRDDEGWWWLDHAPRVPHTYSLKATRPA